MRRRDILSLPGESEVTSHVDLLSSSETKIVPRSSRKAAGTSNSSAIAFMIGLQQFWWPNSVTARTALHPSWDLRTPRE